MHHDTNVFLFVFEGQKTKTQMYLNELLPNDIMNKTKTKSCIWLGVTFSL